MVIHGHTWKHLVIPGHTWQHLLTLGHTWQHLITPGHNWHYLVTPGHTWSYLSKQLKLLFSQHTLLFGAASTADLPASAASTPAKIANGGDSGAASGGAPLGREETLSVCAVSHRALTSRIGHHGAWYLVQGAHVKHLYNPGLFPSNVSRS